MCLLTACGKALRWSRLKVWVQIEAIQARVCLKGVIVNLAGSQKLLIKKNRGFGIRMHLPWGVNFLLSP